MLGLSGYERGQAVGLTSIDILCTAPKPGILSDLSEVGNFAPGPHRDDQERTHWGSLCSG